MNKGLGDIRILMMARVVPIIETNKESTIYRCNVAVSDAY
jgi:hypothetical protein